MSQENVLGEGIIEEAPSAAEYGPAFAGQVVGESDAGREIIVIRIVKAGGPAASHLHRGTAVRGIELVQQIVLLFDHPKIIPAQTEVEGQARRPAEAVLQINAVAVFRSMPQGVAGDLTSAVRDALEQRFQRSQGASCIQRIRIRNRVKAQLAPEIVVDELRDGGAAELVAELDVVLARFPRVVVNEVPVGVHPVARHGRTRAQAREAAHADHRKTGIIWRYSGVQTDGIGIEILVFREEPFGKPVPAQARFIQLVGVDNLHIRNGDQLHPRRSMGIETRHLTAAAGQGQRKRLRAVAEVVASGQQVAGIEIVVDLANQAVDAVREVNGGRNVVRSRSHFRRLWPHRYSGSARGFAPAAPR